MQVASKRLKVGDIDYPAWAEDQPPRNRSRRHRIASVVLVSSLTLLGLYLVVASGLSRRDYATFAVWSAPNRINYCGRRYYRNGVVNGSPKSFMGSTTGQATWRMVGRTFALRPIEAPVIGRNAQTAVCAITLYLPGWGHGNYVEYSLSGGP
jgi:hypothetical protein